MISVLIRKYQSWNAQCVLKKLPILLIEEYAVNCSSKLDVLFEVNSADEMGDGKIDINVTVPLWRRSGRVEYYSKKYD